MSRPASCYLPEGDFDFWRLMGQDRTHSDVADFLAAALGSPSPAKCDSVRVAGMIELLRTQVRTTHTRRARRTAAPSPLRRPTCTARCWAQ